MNPYITQTGWCRRCRKETAATLHMFIRENGTTAFAYYCGCGLINPFGTKRTFIPNAEVESNLTDDEIADLQFKVNPPAQRCARCGNRGAELHHWAPRALFGDECNNWPQDYLCSECHAAWHKVVTPQLVKSREQENPNVWGE